MSDDGIIKMKVNIPNQGQYKELASRDRTGGTFEEINFCNTENIWENSKEATNQVY